MHSINLTHIPNGRCFLISFKQNGINLDIIFGSEVIKTKISLRIFRRFNLTIVNVITSLLQWDPKFAEYYETQLYDILKNKYIPPESFINEIISFVDRWFEAVGNTKKYTLKLLAPLLYTSVLTTVQIKECMFKVLEPLRNQQIDDFIYKFVQLKFSKKSSTTFWNWLSNNKFQTTTFHILNLFYITISILLAQLDITHNPIAFFRSVIEKSIFYIITDVYLQEVRYSEAELKKVKYVKDYSLTHSQIVKVSLHELEPVVQTYFNISPQLLLDYDFSGTYKYIALPLLTKLFKTSYIYFYNYKNWGVCSMFSSLLLKQFAPSLTLLQNITQCFQTYDKKVVLREAEPLQELYNYPSPYQKIFAQKKIFDFVIRELASYKYTQILRHVEVKVPLSRLISEYVSFYKNIILSDQFDTIFEAIRKSNFLESLQSPTIFTSYLDKLTAI